MKTTMQNTLKAFVLIGSCMSLVNTAKAVTQECMDFESFSTGILFPVGTDYTFNDIHGELVRFKWDNGNWFNGGHAEVVNSNLAFGSNLETNLNNINISYTFNGTHPMVAIFKYADHGGNVNLGINGLLSNTQDLSDLNGMLINGVFVIVTRQDEGLGNNHHGTVTLIGDLERIGVGGQEFWLDDVCTYFE